VPDEAKHSSENQQRVGAAQSDVTPRDAQFLYGYPHVERMSTGVHDRLLASAMYLHDGDNQAMFVAVDIIFLTKRQVAEARERIAAATGVPADHIMITATHTHSGPITMRMLSNTEDAVVPEPDLTYLRKLIQGIVEAATEAHRNAQPAEVGLAVTKVSGLGTNRHDPNGPSLPEVPVLVARSLQDRSLISLMCVCSMHPTVLHEDSTLVSGDFPAFARQYLQSQLIGKDCPIVYHMGAAGNQSPRHVTRANTFEEAERLGGILGKAVESVLHEAKFVSDWKLRCDVATLELPLRDLPPLQQAESSLREADAQLEHLRQSGARHAAVRTAECNWFGAQETLSLARAQQDGRLHDAARTCLPAQIQLIGIGPWTFVGWPGEVFTEFALEVRQRYPEAFVITLANGDLQGYLVTAEAVGKKTYEASNAVFASPDSARLLVAKTFELLEQSSLSRTSLDADNKPSTIP